jgi:multidrug efflux system membrane fusion protein
MTVASDKSSEVRLLPGLVTPRRTVTLGFQAAGQIQERLVDVGTRVHQGQLLLVLDTNDYAQSQLAAEDQVVAARAEMKQSVADAERLIALIDKGAVGKAEMERQQARADALQALLDQAHRRLEIARNKLAYASLKAPFDGVVTSLRAEVGQVVAEAEPVLSIAQDDVLEVSVDVPEDLAVEVGLPQTIFQGRLHAASGIGLQLQLREYSPAATAPLRTFRAVFTILNSQDIHHHLRIGMTAEVMLSIAEQKEGQTSLPASALVSTGKDVSVWLLEPGQKYLSKRLVGVTRNWNGGVVVEGLRPGEQVVVAGTDKLTTEMIVRPIERTGTAYVSSIQ